MLLRRLTRKNFIPDCPEAHHLRNEPRDQHRVLFYLYNLLEPILSIDDFQGPKYIDTGLAADAGYRKLIERKDNSSGFFLTNL